MNEELTPTHRHLKTGGLYTLLGYGLIEATLTPCAIYQSCKFGVIWVRPTSEFEDGRFEEIKAGDVP